MGVVVLVEILGVAIGEGVEAVEVVKQYRGNMGSDFPGMGVTGDSLEDGYHP